MTTTKTDSISESLNRIANALEEQTSLLRSIGATIDEALDVEREKLEFLHSQGGETPTEDDDGDTEVEFRPSMTAVEFDPTDVCGCPKCCEKRLRKYGSPEPRSVPPEVAEMAQAFTDAKASFTSFLNRIGTAGCGRPECRVCAERRKH